MNCPNCTHKLSKNPKHAEGVWQCDNCNGVFHIVVTTKPKPIDTYKPEGPIMAASYRNWVLTK